MFKTTRAKSALAAVAGLAALSGAVSAPVAASAQPAYNYDPCQREATGRGVVGALLGGAIGAAVGANAGARGNRQDGALLGGGLGAIGGAVIGNKSAACNGGYAPPPPPPRASYDPAPRDYGYGYDGPRYAPAPAPRYRPGRFEDDYAFGPRGQRLRVVEQSVGPDGCSLAESPIYMPDGRVQTRFVRVCRDSSGRYQVVD